jgi:tetratricopeptide (TPR) repeat protein
MMNNYASDKTKLVSCRNVVFTAIIFSFFFGLSMVGEVGVAAGSISSSQIGGQEFEEEEQQQHLPQICSSVTAGTNANTTRGIVGANNNTISSSLYENPEYAIQILCPENWVYFEEENLITGEFYVYFMSLRQALESQETDESLHVVSVVTMEVPFANLDIQRFADLNIEDLTSSGYEIISTNSNATLSGMPAFEVVYVDANGTMFLQNWTIQDDRAYAVLYASHESKFNQLLPIARDMISSFTITNETALAPSLMGSNNNDNTTIDTDLNTSTTTQFQTSESEGDANSLSVKGSMALEQGRYEEAIEYLDQALAIEPNNFGALTNKGVALDNLGRYQEAIEYYDRVLAIDPNDLYASYNKGALLHDLGRYQEAIEYYDRVLAIDPNHVGASTNKAHALDRLEG